MKVEYDEAEETWYIEDIDWNEIGYPHSGLDGYYSIKELEFVIKQMKNLHENRLTKEVLTK